MLPHSTLLQLKRWNTPTIYNGWEQITNRDVARECFNLEETRDFMPQMGPMVGYAVTLVIEPSSAAHRTEKPNALDEYLEYMTRTPGPKIVVVQDLDKPACYGSAWGEVFANVHRSLGCVGVICDGAVRDIDEMANAGLKAIARRLAVGHAKVHPVHWDCPVEVFGTRIEPGQLIHADKHGFLAIPPEDEERLLEAALFMDKNECDFVIPAARNCAGLTIEEALQKLKESRVGFGAAVREKFRRGSEWEAVKAKTD
jgi:regulator of RNase E activity RraA